MKQRVIICVSFIIFYLNRTFFCNNLEYFAKINNFFLSTRQHTAIKWSVWACYGFVSTNDYDGWILIEINNKCVISALLWYSTNSNFELCVCFAQTNNLNWFSVDDCLNCFSVFIHIWSTIFPFVKIEHIFFNFIFITNNVASFFSFIRFAAFLNFWICWLLNTVFQPFKIVECHFDPVKFINRLSSTTSNFKLNAIKSKFNFVAFFIYHAQSNVCFIPFKQKSIAEQIFIAIHSSILSYVNYLDITCFCCLYNFASERPLFWCLILFKRCAIRQLIRICYWFVILVNNFNCPIFWKSCFLFICKNVDVWNLFAELFRLKRCCQTPIAVNHKADFWTIALNLNLTTPSIFWPSSLFQLGSLFRWSINHPISRGLITHIVFEIDMDISDCITMLINCDCIEWIFFACDACRSLQLNCFARKQIWCRPAICARINSPPCFHIVKQVCFRVIAQIFMRFHWINPNWICFSNINKAIFIFLWEYSIIWSIDSSNSYFFNIPFKMNLICVCFFIDNIESSRVNCGNCFYFKSKFSVLSISN